jgi:uncharacterized protein (DUF433 family)
LEELSVNARLERIAIDPKVCGGAPCIRGTHIQVSHVLELLAGGMTEAGLLAEYPQLVHEDVLAAITYGADAARDQDWAWLDSIVGKLDKDFVRAVNEPPEPQQRTGLDKL